VRTLESVAGFALT
jgi:hypothetical protein